MTNGEILENVPALSSQRAPLINETALFQSNGKLLWAPDERTIPEQTGILTVGRNITLILAVFQLHIPTDLIMKKTGSAYRKSLEWRNSDRI
jgi:hypothetical protein